jgi:orotate phosphoribosyltransferase
MLSGMHSSSSALVEHIKRYSVQEGDFVLKSGKPTNWFCDAKQTACRADGILLIAAAALELIPDGTTAIGGLAAGADPVGFGIAAVAATRGQQLRSFSIRKESKDHGVTGRLSGALEPGDRAVIVEDAVTRGSSPLEAARVVRELGAEPILILAVVDRGGTCADLAAAQGIPFAALVTAPDLGFPYEGAESSSAPVGG